MAERQDRRTRRTRAALIEAFNHLVLRRRGPIRVAEIVEHANVGRSTFYDHYRSAEDLHMEALARPFIPARLASLQLAEAMLAPIRAWVAGEAPCTAAALAAALAETGRRTRPPIRHVSEAAEHGTTLGSDLQTPRRPITSGRAGPAPLTADLAVMSDRIECARCRFGVVSAP